MTCRIFVKVYSLLNTWQGTISLIRTLAQKPKLYSNRIKENHYNLKEMGLPEETSPTVIYNTHRRDPSVSEIADLTFLELQLPPDHEEGKATIHKFFVDEMKPKLPESHLVLITESETFHGGHNRERSGSVELLRSIVDEFDAKVHGKLKVRNWKGTKFYSDYIKEGLEYLDQEDNVMMLFETPSSSSSSNSFHNKSSFKFHDWPPTKESRAKAKSVLGPCRYAVSYNFYCCKHILPYFSTNC